MLDQKFMDNLSLFLEGQIENITHPMQKNDKNYAELLQELEKAGEVFQEVITELPKEKKDLLDDYISVIYSCQSYENKAFYLHGYKDCIKLLFFLDLLGGDAE